MTDIRIRLTYALFFALCSVATPAWTADAAAEPAATEAVAAESAPAAAVESAAAAPDSSLSDTFAFFAQEAQVVTASRRAQTVREAPANIKVITREQLRAQGARTLADVLLFIPGIQIIKHKSGGEQVWVRGTTSAYNDKTLLLIDGHPFKELVYGQHPVNEQLPLVDVDHVELIKGPGSSLYGSNAFTGVINIITVDPRAKQARGEAMVEGGDFNTFGGSVLSSTRKEGYGLVASGSYVGTDGDRHERDENGAVSLRRDSHRLMNANARVAVGDFTAAMRLMDYTRTYFSRADTRNEILPTRTALLSLDWDRELNDLLSLSASGYYNWFDWRREQFRTINAALNNLDRLQFSDEKTQAHGFNAQAEWRLPARNLLLTAVDYEVESAYSMVRTQYRPTAGVPNAMPVINRTASPLNPFAQRWSLAAEDTWSATDDLRLTGGYRYDSDLRFEAQHNVRAGIVFSPWESGSLKLLYGTAYRAPSFRETNTREIPPSGVDDGNPNLKPERIETSEAVAAGSLPGGLSWDLAGYRNVITGVIAPDLSIGQYNNVGSYTTYGIEPTLNIQGPAGLTAYVNYTRQQSIDDQGNRVGNVAEELWNAGLGLRLPLHLTLRADWHRTGRRIEPGGYQAGVTVPGVKMDRLGEYDRTDIVLGTHGLLVNAQVILHNAFDATYYDPDFIEGRMDAEWAGRSIFARLSMEL